MAWCNATLGDGYRHLRVEDIYLQHDEVQTRALFTWLGVDLPRPFVRQLLVELGSERRNYWIAKRDRNDQGLGRWVNEVAGDVLDTMGYPRPEIIKLAGAPV